MGAKQAIQQQQDGSSCMQMQMYACGRDVHVTHEGCMVGLVLFTSDAGAAS